MKRGSWVVAILLLAVAAPLWGQVSTDERQQARVCKAIPNLLIAIQSDNAGLRESAAYLLGEFKCTNAVIPLMNILKSDAHESARVAAALALVRIGDARGTFAVKRAVTFDESPKVRRLCAWFYNQYYHPGSFAFMPAEPSGPVMASE